MVHKKTIAYSLLLALLLAGAALILGTGTTQARYVNTDTWYTALTVTPDARVTSNCLTEGSQTVLLGKLELEGLPGGHETQIPFTLNSTHTVMGTIDWDIPQEQAEYLQAGILLNGQAVTKQVETELPSGENTADLQLFPTQKALETVHEEITVTVSVRWTAGTQTISADFRVTLGALTQLPEPPEDTQPPEEETDPEQTEPSTETEPSEEETTEDPQIPEVLTETEPATEPEETDPTEPEETDPTEPEETDPTEPKETDPTEPEETDPTEPEETDPTEPEETDPTEPEETDPTEPEETDPSEPEETDPTEPEETEPTEPEETEPTEPDVEPVSPVQIRSLEEFSREYFLPAVITFPQGTDRAVLSAVTETGETAPLPPFIRYSLDGGTEWYLLYYGGAVELTLQSVTQAAVLLDLSAVDGQLLSLTLHAHAYAGEKSVGTAEHTCLVSSVPPVAANSEPWLLSAKKQLVLQLNPAWADCTLEYTVQMLTEDETTGEIGYVPVELSWDSLFAQKTGDSLVFELGSEKPGAGAYRVTFTWKFEELCFAVEQASFFINYSSD